MLSSTYTSTRRTESVMMETPEELIAAMSSEELQELLGEMGFVATSSQVNSIKGLVQQMGTLDAALETIAGFESEVRRAA
jgi:hypothetical protein